MHTKDLCLTRYQFVGATMLAYLRGQLVMRLSVYLFIFKTKKTLDYRIKKYCGYFEDKIQRKTICTQTLYNLPRNKIFAGRIQTTLQIRIKYNARLS